jgi:cellobiose dehydrogenase (acceptor)
MLLVIIPVLAAMVSVSTVTKTVPLNTSYDHIIIRSGAGGITVADKLSESGASVLVKKGAASSGRWGGQRKPDWLQGTNLMRFEVPGLCNQS